MTFNEWILDHEIELPPGELGEAWHLLEEEGVDGETIAEAFDLVVFAILETVNDAG